MQKWEYCRLMYQYRVQNPGTKRANQEMKAWQENGWKVNLRGGHTFDATSVSLRIGGGSFTRIPTDDYMEEVEKLGFDSWELISCEELDNYDYRFFFKRPV